MLHTIFLYEWKLLLRSKAILSAIVLFSVIGWLSVNKGVGYYHYQQQAADSVTARDQRSLVALKAQFDTLNFQTGKHHQIENPWSLDRQLRSYAIKPANPLSALSIGQNDIYPRIKRTGFSTEIFGGDQDEFKNPEQLLTGNMDLSYFILFLFPLLFIALSYNTASADREAGIHKLLAAQNGNVQTVTTYRIVFRWLVALVPVLISVIIAWLSLRNDAAFSFGSFMQWLSIALVYTLFWLSIVLLFTGRGWNSMVSALALAGTWLLLLVGIPGILNSWFQYKYPNYIQQEVTQLRDNKSSYAELPLSVHKENFFRHFPALLKDSGSLDTTELRWCSYGIMGFEREEEVHENICKKTEAQNKKEEQLFWINPAGGIMRALSSVSGSTLYKQQQFEKEVIKTRGKKIDYLFGNFFAKPHFTKMELMGIPAYTPKATIQSSFVQYLLPTLLLIGLSLVWSIYKGR